ncbi:MAG: class 1 fructose-bisphosphatase [Chitinophagaceae bacterium]|nr:class 1 fructose-bisphosphatase [Chitinophagaceae bacterium]
MNPNRTFITLDEFTVSQTRLFKNSTGELSTILRDISLACKLINDKVNKAGLTDVLGSFGKENVQGEVQMKLDVYANEILINVLKSSSDCAGVGSEENDDIIVFNDEYSKNSKYVVLFDPLDGSSNIDVNASIGTIFAVYKRISPLGTPCTIEDFLQKGSNLMTAGYVIYGSSTMLVYATKLGVNGFTLDPTIGEFCLSHKDMKCAEDGKIYSINQGNYYKLDNSVKEYIDFCMQENENKKAFSHRYIGSMVADMHRTLIKGGIFIYPADISNINGKLRLLYECNPMSFIIEMAGGLSSNGIHSILEIEPNNIHQRVPIFIGSKKMVLQATGV